MRLESWGNWLARSLDFSSGLWTLQTLWKPFHWKTSRLLGEKRVFIQDHLVKHRKIWIQLRNKITNQRKLTKHKLVLYTRTLSIERRREKEKEMFSKCLWWNRSVWAENQPSNTTKIHPWAPNFNFPRIRNSGCRSRVYDRAISITGGKPEC